MVGVSVDDTPSKLKPYVAQMKMNYPVLQGLGPRRCAGRLRADVRHSGHGRDFARRQDLRASTSGCRRKTRFENEIKALL